MAHATIRCSNCGAEYDASALFCPYCHAENVPVSMQQQEDFLAEIQQKQRDLKNIPQQRVKKANHRVNRAGMRVVVAAVAILILVFAISSVRNITKRARRDKVLQQLEEYYVQQDYEAMNECMRENTDLTFGASFDKYWDVGQVYLYYTWGQEDIESAQQWIHDVEEEYLSKELVYAGAISDYLQVLTLCSELEEKGFVYGEEEVVRDFQEKSYQALLQECYLTQEEIQETLEQYEDYNTDLSKWSVLATDRALARLKKRGGSNS